MGIGGGSSPVGGDEEMVRDRAHQTSGKNWGAVPTLVVLGALMLGGCLKGSVGGGVGGAKIAVNRPAPDWTLGLSSMAQRGEFSLGSYSITAGTGALYAIVYRTFPPAMLAIDKYTGRVQWRDERSFVSAPLLVSDLVVVMTFDRTGGEVLGLDSANGTVRWSFRCPAFQAGGTSIATQSGTVFVVASTGSLRSLFGVEEENLVAALDGANGAQLWQARFARELSPAIAVAQGTVAVMDRSGNVFGLDAGTGKARWQARVPLGRDETGSLLGVPDGFVWTVYTGVGCLDAGNGRQRWEQEGPFWWVTGGSVTDSERLYLLLTQPPQGPGARQRLAHGSELRVIDLTSGKEEWSYSSPVPPSAGAVEVGDMICTAWSPAPGENREAGLWTDLVVLQRENGAVVGRIRLRGTPMQMGGLHGGLAADREAIYISLVSLGAQGTAATIQAVPWDRILPARPQ